MAGSARHSPGVPAVYPVRITPLGSPTVASKRSYVHVPVTLHRPVEGGLCGGGVRAGWVRGRGILGGGGVVPTQYPGYSLIGIARAQPVPRPAYLRPARHSRARLALPHTWPPRTQIWPSGTNKDEIPLIIY